MDVALANQACRHTSIISAAQSNLPTDLFRENILYHATNFAACGWVPIVLRGKIPLAKDWISITLPTWRDRWVNGATNVGIRTGQVSGFVVVDVDVKDGGMDYWQKLCNDNEWPATISVETGSGGRHYYFAYDKRTALLKSCSKCVKDASGKPVGIDIKADGGQVVAPPSLHPTTGKPYEFEFALKGIDIEPMPDWLYDVLVVSRAASVTPLRAPSCSLQDHIVDNVGPPVRAVALGSPRPVYGEQVSVDGEMRTLDVSLVRDVLAKIECPAGAEVWAGFMNNNRINTLVYFFACNADAQKKSSTRARQGNVYPAAGPRNLRPGSQVTKGTRHEGEEITGHRPVILTPSTLLSGYHKLRPPRLPHIQHKPTNHRRSQLRRIINELPQRRRMHAILRIKRQQHPDVRHKQHIIHS